MTTVASITLVIAGFLVLASVLQPAAERLHLPYTVLLAIVGVAIGGAASFLLYTPLTTVFDDIVAPVVNLPFNASICASSRFRRGSSAPAVGVPASGGVDFSSSA